MKSAPKKEGASVACPSCGREVAVGTTFCSCGARWVGPCSREPEFHVLRLGLPLSSWGLILLALMVEVMILAREVYLSDLVWTEALSGMMNYLARVFVPAAVISAYLAYRGIRAVRREPTRYGGLRIARAALTVALLVTFAHGAVFVSRIPRMLENRQLKREAATRANMYHLARAIEEYKQQFGTYPRRLIDLQEMDPSLKPVVDYWGHEFVYETISSDFAAATAPAPFQRYRLASKGADGKIGTRDDIVMQDDVLLGPESQADEPVERAVTPSRTLRKAPRTK